MFTQPRILPKFSKITSFALQKINSGLIDRNLRSLKLKYPRYRPMDGQKLNYYPAVAVSLRSYLPWASGQGSALPFTAFASAYLFQAIVKLFLVLCAGIHCLYFLRLFLNWVLCENLFLIFISQTMMLQTFRVSSYDGSLSRA